MKIIFESTNKYWGGGGERGTLVHVAGTVN